MTMNAQRGYLVVRVDGEHYWCGDLEYAVGQVTRPVEHQGSQSVYTTKAHAIRAWNAAERDREHAVFECAYIPSEEWPRPDGTALADKINLTRRIV